MINPEFEDPPHRRDQLDRRLVSQRAWYGIPVLMFAFLMVHFNPSGACEWDHR